jgi:hypothetical protein
MIKEGIGARATAASLSMPPGAMFSFLFTKHRILNLCRRQEEFLAMQRNRFSDRPDVLPVRKPVSNAAISEQFVNEQKIAADCARIKRPPQEPSTPAQQSFRPI